jgi:hypothetical protein
MINVLTNYIIKIMDFCVVTLVLWADTNILQEHAVSVFSVEVKLNMEAACCSHTLIYAHKTTKCHQPEDYNFNSLHCENLKTYIHYIIFHFDFSYFLSWPEKNSNTKLTKLNRKSLKASMTIQTN